MLRIYNTLTRQKEEFRPAGETVSLYVCGVTPYDDSHVGHAMSYVVFDVVRRWLEYRGYRVRHVQNFTDIDDKIIARASADGVPAGELARRMSDRYQEEMDALNVLRAHAYPRVTEEIPAILAMVQGLVEKGFAYPVGADVYFRVTRDPSYGTLSGRSLDGMMAGSRVEVAPGKEHPMDFVLWKGAKPGEPSWPSPWGEGRPGWHIECSAMSVKYLGPSLDLHGGGHDLIFPHHENEIAQSEAATGMRPFVRCWMHNGLLQMGETKMSKSLGNLVSIREAVERHGADALRLFVLSSHYRAPLRWSDESVAAMRQGVQRLLEALAAPSRAESGEVLDPSPFRDRFEGAMDDDFNASQGVGVLFDLAREINRTSAAGSDVAGAQALLRDLGGVLGLRLASEGPDHRLVAGLMELLIDLRAEARVGRQWAVADRIRDRLGAMGIELRDSPEGTTWRWEAT